MGGGAGAMKVVFVLILSLINLQANADEELVHELCKRTVINDLCVSIVDADPRSELKNRASGVCAILRDRAVAEVSAAKKSVLHILNTNNRNNTFNHYAVHCLQLSSRRYDGMLHDLKTADLNFSVINVTTYSDGLGRMSRTYYGASDNEACFTDRPGTTPSPMTSQNQKIKDVVNVITSILSSLFCKNNACG